MLRYQKLRDLSPQDWRGLGTLQRQQLRRYVAGAFRGFYAEVDGERIYLGRLVNEHGNDAYMIVNLDMHRVSRGSTARDVYRHVASKIRRSRRRHAV